VKLLLDSHTLIWAALDDPQLPERVANLITDPSVETLVSIASFWEIGLKIAAGRWPYKIDVLVLQRAAEDELIGIHPITVEAIHYTSNMDWFNKDPFDRLIAATAITSGIALATIEEPFQKWGVTRVWE
jgi:PIN domain nuclease of toxin-antitoxin system